ncbi:hypothetical protein ABZS77_26725 [Micromonospora sp. NPDC005298]|uniref:hypothetical protein n=1 Tax=Micromonospora sp. NPDC005298 TaxID=3156873 RepID=UPI0033BF0546
MSEHDQRRTPTSGRARKRAIRAQAARAGVAYSVAARQIESVGLRPGEILSTYGRTIYPIGFDPYRQLLVDRRERRSLEERVADLRRAAALPDGRARHLVERFPPGRGRPGSGVGPLYHGADREELLALLYVVVAVESPGLLPEVGDLAWIAELGEETALDMACADVDREVRRLLDREPVLLWPAVEGALAAAERSADWRIRHSAVRQEAFLRATRTPRVGPDGEPYVPELSVSGVRQILDALLVVADDGHAPGTRVRLLDGSSEVRAGTIVGARWGRSGPPEGYLVWLDGAGASTPARADELVVLAGQESVAR